MLRFKVGSCRVCISGSFFALITFILLVSESEIVLISLFSSLLHEAGHIFAMRMLGHRIKCLTFTAVGIRLDKNESTAASYTDELAVSLAGVAVNMLLFLLFSAAYSYSGAELARNIAVVNLIVGMFNLLPVEALDGARALYYILLRRFSPERADKVIIYTSLVTVFLLIFSAFFLFNLSGANLSLVIAIAYLMFILLNHIIQLKK